MASVRADDDPQASEYAGKDSPDDSDNDEGLYVETNANVTKLLTTRGTHDLDTMNHMVHTMRVRYEAGSLPKEEYDRFASFVESALDVLAHMSEGATDPAPVEVQENNCADGSSSACPLVVEDGNRKTLMQTHHRIAPSLASQASNPILEARDRKFTMTAKRFKSTDNAAMSWAWRVTRPNEQKS